MPELFPWSRIEYKFLSQNLWYATRLFSTFCISGSLSWFKTFKKSVYNDIHGVNLSHMHSMLLATALLQHSHKKLTVKHDVFPGLFKSKRAFPMKLSSFHLFGKTFCSPPWKFSTWCKVGSRVLDSRYYGEKYQRKRVACYCYQKLRQTNFFKKNFGKCSQIGCFKVRNSTRCNRK